MKNCVFPLFLLFFASINPAFAQEPRLLASDYCVSFDLDNGAIAWGDSSEYYYDDNNRVIGAFNLSLQNGVWDYAFQTAYFYDSNGLLQAINHYQYNGNNAWENKEYSTHTYDAQGNRIASERYTWDGANWSLQSASAWTYDAENHVLTYFRPDFRWYYAYNAAGLNDTTWSYGLENNEWKIKWRSVYTYDFPGVTEPTESLLQRRENDAWVNHERYLRTFNGNGKLETQTYQSWNGFSQQWTNGSRSTLNYNNTLDLVYQRHETWDGNAWANQSQTAWAYEDPGFVSISTRETWHLGQWVPEVFCRNHYMGLIVQATAPVGLQFEVSPNPASTQLNIRGQQLAKACIYDMQGRQVQTYKIKNDTETSVELVNLPFGSYLLQVFDANGRTAFKPLVIAE